MSYGFAEGPELEMRETWVPGMPPPEEWIDHVRSGGTIRAWNAAFERIISHFCDNEWRRDRISRLCALFSHRALPALRLNVLMGLHRPGLPGVVKGVLTKTGILLGAGRAERERFLPRSAAL